METYIYTFTCKQYIALIISLSLILGSIPAELIGSSFLAPPGKSELKQPASEKDYLFNLFRGVTGFNKLEKLYSKGVDQKNFVIKILRIAQALQGKGFTINEFLKDIRVKIEDTAHPGHNITGIRAHIMITTKDKKEKYLVKILSAHQGIVSFFKTTHRYPEWKTFQNIGNEEGYAGVILVKDKDKAKYEEYKIGHIIGKFFMFISNKIDGLPENIESLQIENLIESAKLFLTGFQHEKAKETAIIVKNKTESLEIIEIALEIIKVANIIKSMERAKNTNDLLDIYRKNLTRFNLYWRNIIEVYFLKRYFEIINNTKNLIEISL